MRLSAISLAIAAAILLATVPLWANQGIVFVVGLALIEAVFALSWNLLFGFTGLASFGHAAFFAMGAYLCGAALRFAGDVPFLVILAGALLLGAVSAVLVGIVSLRRTSGIYLAILTLALSEVLRVVVSYSTLLGREDGLAAIPRPVVNLFVGSVDLTSGRAYYWFILAAACLIGAVLWLLVHGPFGRVLRTIRQDAERATFMGTNVGRYRLASFTISGAVAALSGALYAPWAQIVTPDAGHWIHSTQPMLAALLGGAQSFWGPVVGTILFAGINYSTRTLIGVSEIVIGAILLVVVLGAPDGVLGLARRLTVRWRGGSATKPAARPDPSLASAAGDAS